MKLEIDLLFYYKIRTKNLPLYHCIHNAWFYDCCKGLYYKCDENESETHVRVYNRNIKGTLVDKDTFNVCFKKCGKIRKLLYKCGIL